MRIAQWQWLNQPPIRRQQFSRLLLKSTLLFLAVNLVWGVFNITERLNQVNAYNRLWPGRERFPIATSFSSTNVATSNLDLLFTSHTLSRPKAEDEFRVLVLGDSATWGIRLYPQETMAAQLTALGLAVPDGRRLVAYNLGYPYGSVLKDVMFMDYARRYQPDAVLWFISLNHLQAELVPNHWLIANNPTAISRLNNTFALDFAVDPTPPLAEQPFYFRTLIATRPLIGEWWRLQVDGLRWSLFSLDYANPPYEPLPNDMPTDARWPGYDDVTFIPAVDLEFRVVEAGFALMDGVPILLVNQPIYIATGENRDVRYNLVYPRWAYDGYQQQLQQTVAQHGWPLLDVWDVMPRSDFTDSPFHLNATATRQLAVRVGDALLELLSTETPS